MLELLEAVLEGTASKGQRSYSIAGRSVERIPIGELQTMRDSYARRVELECELEAKGVKRSPRRVLSVLG